MFCIKHGRVLQQNYETAGRWYCTKTIFGCMAVLYIVYFLVELFIFI
jgi:hypothetical protein